MSLQVTFPQVDCETSVRETSRTLGESRSGEVYVIHEGKAVGFICESDIVGLVAQGRNPEHTKAREIMRSPPPVIREDAQLDDLIQLYSKHPTNKVLVVDKDGKPTGAIAVGQFFQGLSCFATGSPLSRVYAALASGPRLEVISALSNRPMKIPELAKRLLVKEVTVRHHLRALMEAGLVREEQSARGKPGRPSALYNITPFLFQKYQDPIKLTAVGSRC